MFYLVKLIPVQGLQILWEQFSFILVQHKIHNAAGYDQSVVWNWWKRRRHRSQAIDRAKSGSSFIMRTPSSYLWPPSYFYLPMSTNKYIMWPFADTTLSWLGTTRVRTCPRSKNIGGESQFINTVPFTHLRQYLQSFHQSHPTGKLMVRIAATTKVIDRNDVVGVGGSVMVAQTRNS